MGARQSKRSVDITTTPKKEGLPAEGGVVGDAAAPGDGKLERIEEADTKPTTNGIAPHTDAPEDKEKDKDEATEKDKQEEVKPEETKQETSGETPAEAAEATTPTEATPATVTSPENKEMKKKDKMKKKWSFRSISFGKKDKSKPAREDTPKNGDVTKEEPLVEGGEEAENATASSPTEEKSTVSSPSETEAAAPTAASSGDAKEEVAASSTGSSASPVEEKKEEPTPSAPTPVPVEDKKEETVEKVDAEKKVVEVSPGASEGQSVEVFRVQAVETTAPSIIERKTSEDLPSQLPSSPPPTPIDPSPLQRAQQAAASATALAEALKLPAEAACIDDVTRQPEIPLSDTSSDEPRDIAPFLPVEDDTNAKPNPPPHVFQTESQVRTSSVYVESLPVVESAPNCQIVNDNPEQQIENAIDALKLEEQVEEKIVTREKVVEREVVDEKIVETVPELKSIDVGEEKNILESEKVTEPICVRKSKEINEGLASPVDKSEDSKVELKVEEKIELNAVQESEVLPESQKFIVETKLEQSLQEVVHELKQDPVENVSDKKEEIPSFVEESVAAKTVLQCSEHSAEHDVKIPGENKAHVVECTPKSTEEELIPEIKSFDTPQQTESTKVEIEVKKEKEEPKEQEKVLESPSFVKEFIINSEEGPLPVSDVTLVEATPAIVIQEDESACVDSENTKTDNSESIEVITEPEEIKLENKIEPQESLINQNSSNQEINRIEAKIIEEKLEEEIEDSLPPPAPESLPPLDDTIELQKLPPTDPLPRSISNTEELIEEEMCSLPPAPSAECFIESPQHTNIPEPQSPPISLPESLNESQTHAISSRLEDLSISSDSLPPLKQEDSTQDSLPTIRQEELPPDSLPPMTQEDPASNSREILRQNDRIHPCEYPLPPEELPDLHTNTTASKIEPPVEQSEQMNKMSIPSNVHDDPIDTSAAIPSTPSSSPCPRSNVSLAITKDPSQSLSNDEQSESKTVSLNSENEVDTEDRLTDDASTEGSAKQDEALSSRLSTDATSAAVQEYHQSAPEVEAAAPVENNVAHEVSTTETTDEAPKVAPPAVPNEVSASPPAAPAITEDVASVTKAIEEIDISDKAVAAAVNEAIECVNTNEIIADAHHQNNISE